MGSFASKQIIDLSKYEFGKFWVTDKASEHELQQVRHAYDASKDKYKNTALHNLLLHGDHKCQLRLLLAIGVHPDLAGHQNLRPSHLTTENGRSSCAQELYPCRPYLSAVNDNGNTPISIGVSYIQMLVVNKSLLLYITWLSILKKQPSEKTGF